MFSPSVSVLPFAAPHLPSTAAPVQDPGSPLQASGVRTPPSAHQSPDFWGHVADLSERLRQHSPQDHRTLTLKHDDLHCVSAALQQAEVTRIPPDRHACLGQWQAELRKILGAGASTQSLLALAGDRLQELSDLLLDVLVTSSRRSWNSWIPLDPCGQQLLDQLGQWMCAGGVAVRAERSAVGRQLLLQAAELQNEIQLGNDESAPALPKGELLHALMDSNTRAHVTLPGNADTSVPLGRSLSALPLRSWRLAQKDTLEWIVKQRPPNLRTLDLRLWRSALDSGTCQLLRQAATELPNLAQLQVRWPLPDDALGDAWTAVPHDGAWHYTRSDRPDGLALLDAAVQQWHGYVMGTCQAIRRKASQPDAACLLAFAARLGQGFPPSKAVCDQLLQMLTQAAKNDESLRLYAEGLRELEGRMTDPVRVMAQLHQNMERRTSHSGGPSRRLVLPSLQLRDPSAVTHASPGGSAAPSPTMPEATSTPLTSPTQTVASVSSSWAPRRSASRQTRSTPDCGPGIPASQRSGLPGRAPLRLHEASHDLQQNASHGLRHDAPHGSQHDATYDADSDSDADTIEAQEASQPGSPLDGSLSTSSVVWSPALADKSVQPPAAYHHPRHSALADWEARTRL